MKTKIILILILSFLVTGCVRFKTPMSDQTFDVISSKISENEIAVLDRGLIFRIISKDKGYIQVGGVINHYEYWTEEDGKVILRSLGAVYRRDNY